MLNLGLLGQAAGGLVPAFAPAQAKSVAVPAAAQGDAAALAGAFLDLVNALAAGAVQAGPPATGVSSFSDVDIDADTAPSPAPPSSEEPQAAVNPEQPRPAARIPLLSRGPIVVSAMAAREAGEQLATDEPVEPTPPTTPARVPVTDRAVDRQTDEIEAIAVPIVVPIVIPEPAPVERPVATPPAIGPAGREPLDPVAREPLDRAARASAEVADGEPIGRALPVATTDAPVIVPAAQSPNHQDQAPDQDQTATDLRHSEPAVQRRSWGLRQTAVDLPKPAGTVHASPASAVSEPEPEIASRTEDASRVDFGSPSVAVTVGTRTTSDSGFEPPGGTKGRPRPLSGNAAAHVRSPGSAGSLPVPSAAFGTPSSQAGSDAVGAPTPARLTPPVPATVPMVFAAPASLPGVSPLVEPGHTAPVEDGSLPGRIAYQIVQAIRMVWSRGVGEAHLRLDPRHFGDLSVSVRVESGQVVARLQADVPAVREWLQANQGTLSRGLAEHELKLDRFEVVAPTDETHDPAGRDVDDRRRETGARPARRPRQAATGSVFEIVA